ncbi:MAG: dihydroneopterin aldolase [Muribaculaceae bacterium]|nr:dihydroneopterin aldolase [Muribaculaceae bacterium]
MESIEITGLEIWARHGVLEQERVVGNRFIVDVRLDVDLSNAMESDLVDDTINYAVIVDIVKREMAVPSNLLENVVWRVRRAIVTQFPVVKGGGVKLTKLTPPISCQVAGVSVTTRW